MGEYANDALKAYYRGGIRVNPNYVPKQRPKVPCPMCEKPVEKTEGLQAHFKDKHGVYLNNRNMTLVIQELETL